MSGSFVHKIIIAGCRRFANPLPSGPSLKRMQMRIARQPDAPTHRRHRYVLVGLVMTAILVIAIFALIAHQPTKSTGGIASAYTTLSDPQTTGKPSSTFGTREQVVTRIHEIFRVRDQAIQTRDPRLLDGIYTVDCPCLKGDQQLIPNLKQERRIWRGVKVSLSALEAKRINDRLWTVSAVATTSSFEITTESGVVVRTIPQGQEFSRFALARPMNQEDWLLGKASVIQERD